VAKMVPKRELFGSVVTLPPCAWIHRSRSTPPEPPNGLELSGAARLHRT
jgi:hypothetical protein